MKMFKISIVSFVLVLSSCGMQKLTPSGISTVKINTNINSAEINDNNKITVKNLKGEYRSFKTPTFIYNSFDDYNFTKNQLSKKRRTLIISHPYYNPDTIVVRRKLRPVVFSLDVLGAITLYLSPSLIIDLANGNIWKVKKSDKTQNLKFSYNDVYYLSRLELAKEKQTIESINTYINNFKESPYKKDAESYKNQLIRRDSLYVQIKKNGDYYSFENFLLEYPNSIYQLEIGNLTLQRFFEEKSRLKNEWNNIGKYVQKIYNENITNARELSKTEKYSEALNNFNYAISIFSDSLIIKEKTNTLELKRLKLISEADKLKDTKNFEKVEKAIQNYKEAQGIKFSEDVNLKLMESINMYSKIKEERERQRQIDIENSAVKCIKCKNKMYQNERGYYPTYWWSSPNLGGFGCMSKPVNEKPTSVGGMGPYCSSSCCEKDHPKKKY